MSRRPETRRKVPNYFSGSDQLALVWDSDGWNVRFWCEQLKHWDWEKLAAVRVGKKLEAEARAAAVKLIRASVVRWEADMAKTAAKVKGLANQANMIESGTADGSGL